jgi:hypothetical protein
MDNYQEVLQFFAKCLAPEPQTDYRTAGGNQSHFDYIVKDTLREYKLEVELKRYGMKLRLPREFFSDRILPGLLDDLEYQLEQSRGRNVKVGHQDDGDFWLVEIQV